MSLLSRRLQYFFSGQNFSDGVRTTVAVLVPAVLLARWGYVAQGVTAAIGALCMSLTDTPGPAAHRRNGLLAALALVGLTTLLTSAAAAAGGWALGLEIGGLSFGLTMLLVWGARAGAVGTAGLLNAVLLLAQPPAPAQALAHAGLLLAGGLWYAALALLVHRVRPYRPAQQALGESIHALARFLALKARFYDPATALVDDYRRLVAQQVVVNEKQEAVRDLLFRTRQIVNETTSTGRRLVLAFVDTVDLYERISAGFYDYAALRTALGPGGVLPDVADLIRQAAAALDGLGVAVQANHAPPAGAGRALPAACEQLQARLGALDDADSGGLRALKKILVNLRDIIRRIEALRGYFDEAAAAPPAPGRAAEHARFVARQEIQPRAFAQNFTPRSAVFRHSVRLTLAALAAFAVGEVFWRGQHSYWILMTVLLMLKPGFSLTRQRNTERILGTLAGAALGGAVLWLLPGTEARFAVLVVFMVVAYSFQRTHYLVTVVFLTAYLLILFSFMGFSYVGVVQERIVDTLLGCAIAFAAGYFLFPNWESEQLTDLLAGALRANLAYLRQLAHRLAGQPLPPNEYRLLRKNVYVSGANLAAAFQRMLAEPKSKQRHPRETHEFVVLNHILAANIAALTDTLREAAPAVPPFSPDSRRALASALAALHKSLGRLAPDPAAGLPAAELPPAGPAPADDKVLREQLAFLQKVSADIAKATEALATAAPAA